MTQRKTQNRRAPAAPKQPAQSSLMEEDDQPMPAQQASAPRMDDLDMDDDRPMQHRGEKIDKMTSLDEMEQAAQLRINDGGRVPIKAALKLQWNDIEDGFHYQYASDSENYPISLQQMVDAGYTFVRHKHGEQRGVPIVKNSRGCRLYLMRCPQEYFEEDQARIHEKSIRQYKEITQVGEREYAGESKELGKGKPVHMEFDDTPDAIRLMEGDDE